MTHRHILHPKTIRREVSGRNESDCIRKGDLEKAHHRFELEIKASIFSPCAMVHIIQRMQDYLGLEIPGKGVQLDTL